MHILEAIEMQHGLRQGRYLGPIRALLSGASFYCSACIIAAKGLFLNIPFSDIVMQAHCGFVKETWSHPVYDTLAVNARSKFLRRQYDVFRVKLLYCMCFANIELHTRCTVQ